MKSVLVTGGLGFIGSHLVERLKKDYYVTILDNYSSNKINGVGLNVINADIRTYKTEVYYDYVIHLAAVASISQHFNPLLFDVNCVGFDNILKVKCGKFIYASSAAAINKENDYGKTKAYNEYKAKHGLGFRFFNVYGERDNGVVGKLMKDNAIVYGGEQTRDFIHVSDVVDCILNNMDERGIIEVGTGVETSIIDLAKMIGKSFVVQPAREYEEKRSVCNNPIQYKVKLKDYLNE